MGDSVSSRKSKIFSQIFHHVFHDIISGENEKAERMEREEEREGERKRQTSQEIKRKNPMKGGPPPPHKAAEIFIRCPFGERPGSTWSF